MRPAVFFFAATSSFFLVFCPSAAAFSDGTWRNSFPPWDEPSSQMSLAPALLVGVLGEFTGNQSACFPTWYMTIRIAVSHINRRDSTVCPAIGNLSSAFQLKYDMADTSDQRSLAIVAASGLVQQGVKAILGPTDSGSVATVAPFGQLFDLPLLSWQAASDAFADKTAFPTFFRTGPSQGFLMSVMGALLHHLGFTRVNGIILDDDSERSQAHALRKALRTRDAIIQEWSLPPNFHHAALVGVLESVRSSGCRVVFVSATTMQAYEIWTAARVEHMMASDGWAWFGSYTMLMDRDGVLPANARQSAFRGAIFVEPGEVEPTFPNFVSLWQQHMATTQVPEFTSMPTCWQNSTCSGLSSFTGWQSGVQDADLHCRDGVPFAYESAVVLALALDLLLKGQAGIQEAVSVENVTSQQLIVALKAIFRPGQRLSCLGGGISFNSDRDVVFTARIKNWQASAAIPQQIATHQDDLYMKVNFVWTIGARIEWPNGASAIITNQTLPPGVPSGVPKDCNVGAIFDFKVGLCEICPAGTHQVEGDCLPCAAGKYQSEEGRTECESCPPGSSLPDIRATSASLCAVCSPGRFALSSGSPSCTDCIQGRYNPESNQTKCRVCPLGGQCDPGAKGFIARPNFYTRERFMQHITASGDSEDISGIDRWGPWMCIVPEACEGNNTCREGMQGFMCGECAPHYQRKGPFDLCGECPEAWMNIGGFVIILVVGFIAIVILDMMNAAIVGTVSGVASVVTKVLCNFFVLLSAISQTIQLDATMSTLSGQNGPSKVVVASLFATNGASKAVQNPQKAMLSLPCLIHEFGESYKVTYAIVAIGWLLIPVGLVGCFICIFFYFLVRPSAREKQSLCWATYSYWRPISVVFIYFLHPIATAQFLSVFSCEKYDQTSRLHLDTDRLMMDLDVTCSGDEHFWWQLMAILGLAVYSFGIPGFFWYRLWKKQSKGQGKLYTVENLRTYGFIMDGFEPSCYYYESLFMIRRVLFLVIATPSHFATPNGRTVLLLALSCFFLSLHLFYRPFDNRAYNGLDRLETVSLTTLILCLFGRLVEVTSDSQQVLETMDSIFGTSTLVFYLPAFTSVVWFLGFTIYLYLRGLLWPLHDWHSPWLPLRCNLFFNRRLVLSLVPPPDGEKLEHENFEHEHVTLAPKACLASVPPQLSLRVNMDNFFIDREHFLLKTFVCEAVDIIVKRHELCFGSAADAIYVPTFLLQLERLFAVCINMVLKERMALLIARDLKKQRALEAEKGEDDEVEEMATEEAPGADAHGLHRSISGQIVSQAMTGNLTGLAQSSKHLAQMGASGAMNAGMSAVSVTHGKAKQIGGAGLTLGNMMKDLALDMIKGGGLNETEQPELFGKESIHIERYAEELRKPVSMEEVHNELMMLTPRLLDKKRATEGNMLQRLAGSHAGLFDHAANITALFDPDLHRRRIEEWRGNDGRTFDPGSEEEQREVQELCTEGFVTRIDGGGDSDVGATSSDGRLRRITERNTSDKSLTSDVAPREFDIPQDILEEGMHGAHQPRRFFPDEFWGVDGQMSTRSDTLQTVPSEPAPTVGRQQHAI